MKNAFYITTILILIGAVVYLVYFKKPNENLTIITNTMFVKNDEQPIRRLSSFVDAHADKLLSPLSEKETIIPTQEIRQIRETLVDLQKTINNKDKKLYMEGAVLCNMLLQVIEAREDHNRRLADTLTKKPVSLASKDQAEDDIQRKWKFFHDAILRSWDARASKLRDDIDKQYSYVRLLER
jgi:hypothetical protein